MIMDSCICKIILEAEYFKKYDLSSVKIFQKNCLFHPEMIRRPLFCFKDTNTGRSPSNFYGLLLIFNYLKQNKLIFNFLLTVTEKINR